jgi:hypothetical protein
MRSSYHRPSGPADFRQHLDVIDFVVNGDRILQRRAPLRRRVYLARRPPPHHCRNLTGGMQAMDVTFTPAPKSDRPPSLAAEAVPDQADALRFRSRLERYRLVVTRRLGGGALHCVCRTLILSPEPASFTESDPARSTWPRAFRWRDRQVRHWQELRNDRPRQGSRTLSRSRF